MTYCCGDSICEYKKIVDDIQKIRGKWHRREIDDRETIEQFIEALQK